MKFAPDNKALSALWFTDQPAAVAQCKAALVKHNGHRNRAAEELRISVRVLYRWLKKYPAILQGKEMRGLTYEPTVEESARRTAKRRRTQRKNAATARS